MKKLILSTFITLLLFSCEEAVKTKTTEIVKSSNYSLKLGSSCEQTDFSTIPASNLYLYTNQDTVFKNYTQESLLIHIPDSTSIANGDNKMKILFQSSNYSGVTSIEKSKIVKDGVDCLHNYIVLNLEMDETSPSNQPIEYEMSVPISVTEWSTTDMVMIEVGGEKKKVVVVRVEEEPTMMDH